jgi:acetyltransferase
MTFAPLSCNSDLSTGPDLSPHWTMRDGSQVIIRPIHPNDEGKMALFHLSLSDQSIYERFFHSLSLYQRVSHERLQKQCDADGHHNIALVVECPDPNSGLPEIIGVGRLTAQKDNKSVDFALIVSDRYQGFGLGTELLARLIQIARREKFHRMSGEILPDNIDMVHVAQKLGFEVHYAPEEQIISVHQLIEQL